MGLDMYLYARRPISEEKRPAVLSAAQAAGKDYGEGSTYLPRWNHDGPEQRAATDAVLDLAGLTPMLGEESNSGYVALDGGWVSVMATYWRKANAVHAWFVDHCQDGVDECQEAEVHPEQLAALLAACTTALYAYRDGDLRAAEEAMAPRSGFFFGSTDIDEWWAEDMEYTIRELQRVIKAAIEIGNVTFFYQSSW